MTFTREEKIAEIDRELRQRKRVYRRLVHDGKLKQEDADRQTFILQAIRDDYEREGRLL